jgi:hypothetical protein
VMEVFYCYIQRTKKTRSRYFRNLIKTNHDLNIDEAPKFCP